jgi:tetratricopeptide (TPR) repeat protein
MKEFIFSSLVIICFALLSISFILDGKLNVRRTAIFLTAFVYFLYNLISLLAHPYTESEHFVILSYHMVLFFIVAHTSTTTSRNLLMYTLMFVSFLSSIYAFLQFLGLDYEPFTKHFASRLPVGTSGFAFFGNPNLLGGFSVIMIPLTIAYLLHSLHPRHKLSPYLFSSVLLLHIISLIISQTRGSYISAASSVALFMLLYLRTRVSTFYCRYAILSNIVLCIIIVTSIMCGLALKRADLSHLRLSETLLDPTSIRIRVDYYKSALNMIRERPLFGRGIGTFNVYYPEYRDSRTTFILRDTSMKMRLEHAHNEHLELLSDLGIMGYALFMTIVILALVALVRKREVVELGIAIAIIGILIDGLSNQNLRHTVISSILWLSLGLSETTDTLGREGSWQKVTRVKILGIVLVVVLSAGLLNRSFRLMQADGYLAHAVGYYLRGDKRRAANLFEEALLHDGGNNEALYYLADSWRRAGDDDRAIEYYDKLLRRAPNYLQANYEIASVYLRRGIEGDWEKAKSHLLKQIGINNMYWRAYYALAAIYAKENKREEAIRYLKEIEKIGGIIEARKNETVPEDYKDIRISDEDYVRIKKLLWDVSVEGDS